MNIRKVEAVARIRDKQHRPNKQQQEARERFEYERILKDKKK